MPIVDIFRIDVKPDKSINFMSMLKTNKKDRPYTYVIGLPSLEDDEGKIYYTIEKYKEGKIDNIRKTDYDEVINNFSISNLPVRINFKSNEYDDIITEMAKYLENLREVTTDLDTEDISIITKEFDDELHKKGNTDILTYKLKRSKKN